MYVCITNISLVVADPMAPAARFHQKAVSDRQDKIKAEREMEEKIEKMTPDERGEKLAELVYNCPANLNRKDDPEEWKEVMLYIRLDTNYKMTYTGEYGHLERSVISIIGFKNQPNILEEIIKIKDKIPPDYLDLNTKILKNAIYDCCTNCDYGEVVEGLIRLGISLDFYYTLADGAKVNPLFQAVCGGRYKTASAILETDIGKKFAREKVSVKDLSTLGVGVDCYYSIPDGIYTPVTLAWKVKKILGDCDYKGKWEFRRYKKMVEMFKKGDFSLQD